MFVSRASAGLPMFDCIPGFIECDPYSDSDVFDRERSDREERSTDAFSQRLDADLTDEPSYYSRPGTFDTPVGYTERRRADGTMERVPLFERTSSEALPPLPSSDRRPFEYPTTYRRSSVAQSPSSLASSVSENQVVPLVVKTSPSVIDIPTESCVDLATLDPFSGTDDDVIGARCLGAASFLEYIPQELVGIESFWKPKFIWFAAVFGLGALLFLSFFVRQRNTWSISAA